MIQFFEEPSGSGRLPYAKEYIMENPESIDVLFTVLRVVRRPKGLLIVTDFFSGSVWSGRTSTENLREALDSWTNGTVPMGTLVVKIDEWGNVLVGIDSTIPCTGWRKVGFEYHQILKKKPTSKQKSQNKKQNPFLSSPPIITGSNSNQEEQSTASGYEEQIGH